MGNFPTSQDASKLQHMNDAVHAQLGVRRCFDCNRRAILAARHLATSGH